MEKEIPRIPKNIVVLAERTYKSFLCNPIEKIMAYIYENNVLPYEYARRKVSKVCDISNRTLQVPLGEAIENLIDLKDRYKNACLETNYNGDLILSFVEEETDDEYARRIFFSVISPIDKKFEKAKNKKEDLLKEKADLEKRLKEINGLLS